MLVGGLLVCVTCVFRSSISRIMHVLVRIHITRVYFSFSSSRRHLFCDGGIVLSMNSGKGHRNKVNDTATCLAFDALRASVRCDR